MHIEFLCSCGAKMRTAAANVGKRTRCPKCGAVVQITDSAAKRPLVVAKPAASVEASPAFDPLALGDLNFPPLPTPTVSAWSAPAGYGTTRRKQSGDLRWLWIALGVGAACLLGFLGIGTVVWTLAKSAGKASVASSFRGTPLAPAASTLPQGPPISESEAEAVVQRFVAAVRSRDFNLCKSLFNVDRIYEEIAVEAKMSGAERRGFLEGARRQPQFWEQVHSVVMTGGEYELLGPVLRNGQTRIVVRLNSEQTGLNYHEFILRRNEKQQIDVADVYIMVAGNTIGDAMRQVVLAMVGDRNSSLLGRFGAGNRKIAESGKTMQKVKSLAKTSPQLALKEFKTLPPELQKDKTMMILKLQLCAAVSPQEYATTFEEFERAFPGDASLDLLSIDYHINRNDHRSALVSAERLNAYVGGDPLLEKMITKLRLQ